MELELLNAFQSIGIENDKATVAVESISKEIDRRYTLHQTQLATKSDIAEIKIAVAEIKAVIAEAKTDSIKWSVGTFITTFSLFIAITKLWH